MELLQVNGVSKTIGKKNIIKDISFCVNPGEIVGFLGPNGAGKTTTMKMIMGLFSITKGNISVCGLNIETQFEQAMSYVGGIIENPEMYAYLSGADNLRFFANMYPHIGKEKINQIVTQVKLSNRINDKVKTYSLGMRQRLGLAQALLHDPRLLILDEPTNGLDPLGIKEFREIVKNLSHQNGVGILVSSHQLAEMELMCDRIIIIDQGHIIDTKTVKELASDTDATQIPHLYTVETDNNKKAMSLLASFDPNIKQEGPVLTISLTPAVAAQAARVLVLNDLALYNLGRREKSLEDTFIDITSGSKGQIR